jgi:peptidoglycan/xylan/chitin deacetylase (PgdA/CDA1 family)
MRALSLEYHDVTVGAPDLTGFAGAGPASYKLPAEEFSRHIDAIAARTAGAERVTDLLDGWGSRRPFFLTFDDGGRSAWTHIADVLERHGWRGHFFITAGRVDAPTFLSRAEIRALRDRGHVIGTHSYTHPTRMGACPRHQLIDEWERSVGRLQDILGQAVLTGSVPGGFYTRPVAETAAKAGLKALFISAPTTLCRTIDGCLVLGRYTLRRWSTSATAAAIAAGAPLPRASQWMLYTALNLARTVAGERYTQLRTTFWANRS